MSQIGAEQDVPVVRLSLSYRNLRALFIAGFVLDLVLVFVPIGSLSGQSFSQLDSVRSLFGQGQTGLGLLSVSMFSFMVICSILAAIHPRRSVFIAGGCYAVFGVTLNLFTGSGQENTFFLPRLLDYVATAAMLAGFWIRPPRT